MITLKNVLDTQIDLFNTARELVDTKGKDYSRATHENGDTLYNLRVPSLTGIDTSPMHTILSRVSDKMQRLNSLKDPKDLPAVKNESVRDTVVDIINYVSYFYCFYKEKEEELKNGNK